MDGFRKIRLLFAIDGIEFGGGERLFAQLMNRLPRGEYEIFLVSAENPDFRSAIVNPDIRFIPVDFSSRFNPPLITHLAKIIRRNEIQIVNGQGARAEFYARLASRLAGRVRYVSTFQMPVEGYNVPSLVRKIYSIFDRFSERYVDRFIVVSEALRETARRGHDIPSRKVALIYNGIETDYFNPADMEAARQKIRKEFGLDGGRPVVAGIGRMVWQKGFGTLIRSFRAVSDNHPDALLLMVGDGPLRQELEALSRRLKLSGRVIFTGFRADVRDIISGIDLFAVPSLLEGFPMVTLEAMAMGKPIVATDIDGTREQIRDGESGLIVPPENPEALAAALSRLLEDRGFAARLGSGARSRVAREFPIEKTVAETMEVYRSLLT